MAAAACATRLLLLQPFLNSFSLSRVRRASAWSERPQDKKERPTPRAFITLCFVFCAPRSALLRFSRRLQVGSPQLTTQRDTVQDSLFVYFLGVWTLSRWGVGVAAGSQVLGVVLTNQNPC